MLWRPIETAQYSRDIRYPDMNRAIKWDKFACRTRFCFSHPYFTALIWDSGGALVHQLNLFCWSGQCFMAHFIRMYTFEVKMFNIYENQKHRIIKKLTYSNEFLLFEVKLCSGENFASFFINTQPASIRYVNWLKMKFFENKDLRQPQDSISAFHLPSYFRFHCQK